MIEVKKINYEENKKDLIDFFNNCGIAKQTFTYFDKREFSIIKNHLVNFMAFDVEKNIPIGYSHLESENDIIWFGICVSDGYRGKGLGNLIMKQTLEYAKNKSVKEIWLSVYKDNIPAISLYEKMKFNIVKENEKSYFMKLEL